MRQTVKGGLLTRRFAETGLAEQLLTISKKALLRDGEDVAFRKLLLDFFAFAQKLDEARTRFASHIGLSAAQYMSLIAIAQGSKERPLGINELARRLHLSGAFVTVEVNKLVAEGLVEKRKHPTDRRRVQLFATPAGRDRLAHLAAFQRPVNDALFGTLSSTEFDRLSDVLSRLVENADAANRLAEHLEGVMEKPRSAPGRDTAGT